MASGPHHSGSALHNLEQVGDAGKILDHGVQDNQVEGTRLQPTEVVSLANQQGYIWNFSTEDLFFEISDN